ncbi:hypothetical protein DWV29_10750 [Enterocloster asparagiformis]|uniref:Uncharacterized protein n=1 Tax=Enterocloster asparagiformis TaxID=333367 RepID=A0A413FFY9_9FIRM|nr:hypothetical protein DWV29_10750 [Enterocloster asparagiformis]
MHITRAGVTDYRPLAFTCAAPVGISSAYLNLGELAAGDSLSLPENKPLLNTFIAFAILNLNSILATLLEKVKMYSRKQFRRRENWCKKSRQARL